VGLLQRLFHQIGGPGHSEHKFTSGVIWSVTGSAFARTASLISSMLVGRILGPSSFGELSIVLNTLLMFQSLGTFGLGMAGSKFVAEYRQSDPMKAGRIASFILLGSILFGTVSAVALAMLAKVLSTRTLGNAALEGPIQLAAVNLFLIVIQVAQTGILAGLHEFRSVAFLNLIAPILSIPLQVALTKAQGVKGALIGLAIANVVCVMVGQWLVSGRSNSQGVSLRMRGSWLEKSKILNFAFPSVLATGVVVLVNWGANAVVANSKDGYREVGLFNAALQWRAAVLFLPGVLATAVVPVLSSLKSQGSLHEFRRVFWLNVLLCSLSSAFVAVVVFFFSATLTSFFGTDFQESSHILRLVALGSALSGVAAGIGHYLTSVGFMWWALFLNAIWSSAYIGGVVTIHGTGALRLSLSLVIAYGIHLVGVGLFTYLKSPRRSSALFSEGGNTL
jgi:O-antigen/teichoic acid export membrane protein